MLRKYLEFYFTMSQHHWKWVYLYSWKIEIEKHCMMCMAWKRIGKLDRFHAQKLWLSFQLFGLIFMTHIHPHGLSTKPDLLLGIFFLGVWETSPDVLSRRKECHRVHGARAMRCRRARKSAIPQGYRKARGLPTCSKMRVMSIGMAPNTIVPYS